MAHLSPSVSVKNIAIPIARASLSVQKSRRKDVYDRRVLSRKFSISQWLWYFIHGDIKGGRPKWSKMYVGPMLIVDVISATNVKIQKSRNSPSQVVRVDKLKVCRGETPKSWPLGDMDDNSYGIRG